mmetsp:Transcript_17247/g.24718  ORF Transcript_17247/g.24718 Transcript_17247/m.24718 type:complete len:90 (-) Transcript_17247:447-716(-)
MIVNVGVRDTADATIGRSETALMVTGVAGTTTEMRRGTNERDTVHVIDIAGMETAAEIKAAIAAEIKTASVAEMKTAIADKNEVKPVLD